MYFDACNCNKTLAMKRMKQFIWKRNCDTCAYMFAGAVLIGLRILTSLWKAILQENKTPLVSSLRTACVRVCFARVRIKWHAGALSEILPIHCVRHLRAKVNSRFPYQLRVIHTSIIIPKASVGASERASERMLTHHWYAQKCRCENFHIKPTHGLDIKALLHSKIGDSFRIQVKHVSLCVMS
jgi:hypothetical protein